MLDNHDNRNLSDVFKELQEIQQTQTANTSKNKNKFHKFKPRINFAFRSRIPRINSSYKNSDLKLSHIIIGCGVLIVGLAVFFPKNTSFTQSYAKEETVEKISEYELNRHRLNMQSIISENTDMDRVKEQATEEREVEFKTEYNNNPSLPKGEEIITQDGIVGKENVTVIKTYENGNFIEETILSKESIIQPTSKLIDVGTSEFLAKHKIHIGDTMYFIDNANLKKEAGDDKEDVAEIKKYLDVKLLELPNEEWCKVSFDTVEGYIKTSNLTSSYTTPNIIDKNRIQKLLIKVNIDMELNKASGLTLNDYKKIFTGLPKDTNKIFQDNYTAFYNAEKKYNINGIFLASIAIHESGWGTSQIANDKKNLFGYGSYDATPYESSFEFEDYSEGIYTVAKSLVKYYLNPSGTKIYDGETAAAWYYNGPSLKGVNTRYASDPEWHLKVYSYMETLYNKLQ
ncbi:MAG: hypothetical protein HFJ36_03910 [Clostridia bacterium]|nr:hypothetical protein [Clostridia bacterium]